MNGEYVWVDGHGVCWKEDGKIYKRVAETLTRKPLESHRAFMARIDRTFPNYHDRAGWMSWDCKTFKGYKYAEVNDGQQGML